MSAQQLDGHQADQAKPRDDNGLAQRRLDKTNTLQRDGTEHREGRLVVADVVRHACGTD